MSVGAETDQRLTSEHLHLFVQSMRGAYVGSALVSILLTFALWSQVPRGLLLGWCGFALIAAASRAWYAQRVLRAATDAQVDIRVLYATVVAGGVTWGALALIVPMVAQPEYRMLIVTAVAGITAAATSAYALILPSAFLFLGLVLLPLIIAHFIIGNAIDVVVGTMITFYFIFLLRNAINLNRSFGQTLTLRNENAEMVEKLREGQKKAEVTNTELRRNIVEHEATALALIKAKDIAETSVRAKSEFLAKMSHEIRTPMNGVLGLSELLQRTELNKRQQKMADLIHSSGQSLLNIINDILDFSKIEAGKLVLQSVPFELHDLIDEIGEIFAEPAHRIGVDLVCDVRSGTQSAFRGDPDRIRQVLTNLVGNALKFTARGEVMVTVTREDENAQSATLRFAVADTGIGIAEEHQGHIFDSFAQVDGSASRKFGGTGLGLAISKQLVELMGGRVGLHSALGKGSTFWFTCPLLKAEAGELSVNNIDPTALAGVRVLVLGAEDSTRKVLAAQLAAWQVEVIVLRRGADALARLREQVACGRPVSAVIFPRELPDMPALKLAALVRAEPALRGLRMIMLITIANLEATGELLSSGVSAYLTKPVRRRELYGALVPVNELHDDADIAPAQIERRPKFRATVLLVEDNEVNQEVGRSMLESLGCRVRIAENGAEAVKAITERSRVEIDGSYDLILMDCQMPVMDGYAATLALRQWERQTNAARVPIVAVTANALASDQERCIEHGMDDYLIKPFSQNQIESVLQRWISANSTAATQGANNAVLDQDTVQKITALQGGDSVDLLEKLIGLFLGSLPQLRKDIEVGAATGDTDRMRRAVHTLKSSSAYLGAITLSEICAGLEELAIVGDLDTFASRLAEFEIALDAALSALLALRPNAIVTLSGTR